MIFAFGWMGTGRLLFLYFLLISMKHIYEKDKKYYKYNNEKKIFYEIKLNLI